MKRNPIRNIALDPFQNPLRRSFVLPDFQSILQGYVKPLDEPSQDFEQVFYNIFQQYVFIFISYKILSCYYKLLTMETERFSVPEVLFHPQIIGLNQAGISEATWQSYQQFKHIVNMNDISLDSSCHLHFLM
jgi:actin-related protein 6